MRQVVMIAATLALFASSGAHAQKVDADGRCHAADGKLAKKELCEIRGSMTAVTPPAGATAACNDGTFSMSKHHSGSCSSHKGVKAFLGK
jgi:hypothetical protein